MDLKPENNLQLSVTVGTNCFLSAINTNGGALMSLPAMFQYEYPKLSPNWDFWILQQKIFDAMGTRPDTNDWFAAFSGTEDVITIYTSRELTTTEKNILDAVMSDPNAGLYPASQSGFTVFSIEDLFDSWRKLETATGQKIKWMFCNIPDHTKLEIWIEGALTTAKKKSLMDGYAKLITEKI